MNFWIKIKRRHSYFVFEKPSKFYILSCNATMCFCKHFSNIFCLDKTSYLQPVQYQTIKFRCLQSAISLKIFKLSTVPVGSWFYDYIYNISSCCLLFIWKLLLHNTATRYLLQLNFSVILLPIQYKQLLSLIWKLISLV